MPSIAVVAHSRKSLGGGLPELRRVLAAEGVTDPLWYEVTKSRHAARYARRAVARGAELIFVWGGDGTVQRCIDAVAGTDSAVAILPAGTANLLAMNLDSLEPDLLHARGHSGDPHRGPGYLCRVPRPHQALANVAFRADFAVRVRCEMR
jgi:diacylglycerol kinase (ATP)